MSGAIFSIVIVLGGAIALLLIFLKSINIGEGELSDKNRKSSKKVIIDKKTQGFLEDLENEAKEEARYNEKSNVQFNESVDDGLMNKVKRLKSLYNNGTLTKAEFEKAKNKLLE